MTIESVSPLPRTWEIPAKIRGRVSDRAGRQRAIFEDGHLLLVLHHPPQPGERQRRGRYFWRKPDGVWTVHDGSSGPGSLAEHLKQYGEAVHRFDLQEERAEGASAYFDVIDGVVPLVRATHNLYQVLQEARRLVPDDRRLISARDQAYELSRTAELLQAAAKNGLEFEIARRAEEEAESSRQMARSAYRLNILAALFFPLATITSVLGINLNGPWGTFPMLAAIISGGLLTGLLLAWAITRPGKID